MIKWTEIIKSKTRKTLVPSSKMFSLEMCIRESSTQFRTDTIKVDEIKGVLVARKEDQ